MASSQLLDRTAGHRLVVIEDRTIQPIPLDQRHGRPWDLFTLWFGANLTILTVATGALSTTVFHLSPAAAIAAIIVGNLFGAIFMALHAAQGPHLGVPQMVQTRGQFGARGALAVIAFVAVMDVGFVATNLVLSAQSLHYALPGTTSAMAIGVVAILGTAATIFGHDLIHRFTRHMSWLCGIAILACCAWIIWQHPLGRLHAAPPLTMAALIGATSTSVLWQIAYAPYVSDYSRYLPADTGARPAFWMSFWGCSLGSILPMALGALVGSLFPGQEIAQSLAAASGPFGAFAVVVLTLGIAAASAISLYCAVLAAIAIVQTFAPTWQARALARTLIAVVLALIAVAMALLAGPHFMETYTNFLLLLLYVMAPWTAINLVDYYLIRHGSYDVASFLQADGGVYGRYNVPALLSYAVGIVIQVPFVANGLYTGPIARALGGADLSWITGLLVTSLLYYAIGRFGSFAQTRR